MANDLNHSYAQAHETTRYRSSLPVSRCRRHHCRHARRLAVNPCLFWCRCPRWYGQ
ncbi:Uncharacterised protein [Vibrio cholerae]|nr:Uncharacterised protein [Vibrio cholerae]CSB90466.1 Uncharacterised protein [Vibrio cholerae]CSC70140.1 Uncharacterised protein [Vibrio cholerae]CSD55073.1 Uncharacterised protein [Vibrio cholerae]CSD89187.1 Uncharacterised protein [Vibrio cholerae]